jgi:hypothetical protein
VGSAWRLTLAFGAKALSVAEALRTPEERFADPDPQHAVGTCDHLRRGRPRISSESIDGRTDPAAYRLVEGEKRLPGTRPHSIRYRTVATARPQP